LGSSENLRCQQNRKNIIGVQQQQIATDL